MAVDVRLDRYYVHSILDEVLLLKSIQFLTLRLFDTFERPSQRATVSNIVPSLELLLRTRHRVLGRLVC